MSAVEPSLRTGNRSKPLQQTIAVALALGWIVYLIYLLTARTSPELGEWAGPPHLTSSVFLALTLSTVLSPFVQSNALLGWWTIIASTSFIIAFECLQLLSPVRTFQLIDIAEGIAGAAIAAMVAATLCRLMGRQYYIWLAIAVAALVLVASPFLWIFEKTEVEVGCDEPITANPDWQLQLVHGFVVEGELVSSSIGSLCQFGDTSNTSPATNVAAGTESGHNGVILSGAGLVSAPLNGLRSALATSGQLTFGVRFKADNLEAGRPPRQVVSLQTEDERPLFVTRLLQNGPHASVSLNFGSWQGSSTTMANRLQSKFHEVVLTYDGTVQTTYFDGQPIGTEITGIDALKENGSELILNIGKRTDGRWKVFFGEIEAIVIGTKSISADKVTTLFQHSR